MRGNARFVALFFPMLTIPALGVDQSKWLGMIVIFSIIALPCVMLFYKVEDDILWIYQEVIARHKAEAAAAGKEWLSAEEIAAKEQEEQDRLAEGNRIRELKEKCEKKGLDFDEEEAKYQAALTAKQAKESGKISL